MGRKLHSDDPQVVMKPMALGKPSPVSITLAVVMIGVIGYLAWQATSKTDSQSYTKGATHNETNVTFTPTYNAYPLSVPPLCGKIFSFDKDFLTDTKPKEAKK